MSSSLDALFNPVNDNPEDMRLNRLFEREEDPHNIDAEIHLLNSLMFQNDGFDQVADILEPIHFYDDVLGRIYGAMRDLMVRGDKANPVTLKRVIPDDNDAVVQVAAAGVVSVMNNREYARVIINMWQRREMVRIGRILAEDARMGDMLDDPGAIREDAEAALFSLSSGMQIGSGAQAMAEFSGDCLQVINEGITAARKGEVTGVSVGIHELDRNLSGFQPGNLIILAGRPSMGKTALALSMALHAARSQAGTQAGAVAFFSLEMTREELTERLLSNTADIDYTAIIKRVLNDDDFTRLAKGEDDLRRLSLFIDDRPAATIARMRTECRKVARKADGLKMVVVDYLQLMSGGPNVRPGDRYGLITELSMQLKQLAKELKVPVIALSQLSRQVESRDDKRPLLSDLRESGSIEQDADVVMFVYREQYYLERSEPVQKSGESTDKFGERYAQWQERLNHVNGTADIIVAKARRGRVGTVRCAFMGHRQRFSNLEMQKMG